MACSLGDENEIECKMWHLLSWNTVNVSRTQIANLNAHESKTSYSILSTVANRQTQCHQKHNLLDWGNFKKIKNLWIRTSTNGGL